jgi:hypothetical protein
MSALAVFGGAECRAWELAVAERLKRVLLRIWLERVVAKGTNC